MVLARDGGRAERSDSERARARGCASAVRLAWVRASGSEGPAEPTSDIGASEEAAVVARPVARARTSGGTSLLDLGGRQARCAGQQSGFQSGYPLRLREYQRAEVRRIAGGYRRRFHVK